MRCPVVNWMSFAGTADITLWGYYRFHGYPWDNAEKYLEHSPLMYVGNVTTPTLLMTGELDLRTPMGQTEEYAPSARGADGVAAFPQRVPRHDLDAVEFHPYPALHSGLVR